MKTISKIIGIWIVSFHVYAADWAPSGSNIYYDAGNVGFGVTNPGTILDIFADPYTVQRATSSSDTAWQGNFMFMQRSRGTKGAPATVVNGDTVGVFDFWAHDGTSYKRSASLRVDIDGAVSTGIGPSKIGFYTTDAAGSIGPRMMIKNDGKVGINTTNPTHELSVNGTIQTKEVVVESGWADYVFQPGYKLMPLHDVEEYINTNGHLPGMVTAEQVQSEGLSVGAATSKLLEKVEELTLYVIDLQKQNKNLMKQVAELSNPGE